MRGRRRTARRAFLRWWSVAAERAHPVTRSRRRHRRRVDRADPGRGRTSSSSLFRLRFRFGCMQHLRRVIEGHLLLLRLRRRRHSALVRRRRGCSTVRFGPGRLAATKESSVGVVRAARRSLARQFLRRRLRLTLTLVDTLQRLPWPLIVLLLCAFRNRGVRTTALIQRRRRSATRIPRFRSALVASTKTKERAEATLATLHLRRAVPLSLRLARHRQRLCP